MKRILFTFLLLLIVILCSFIPVVEFAKQRRKKEAGGFWQILSGNSESSDEENIEVKKQQILDRLLNPQYYDKRVRPKGNGPTNVSISMYVLDVIDMDEYLKEFTLQCYFRQKWIDEGLVFDQNETKSRKMRSAETNVIWKPDLFFVNEIKGERHDIMAPNRFLQIAHDGEVLLSNRVSVVLSCHSNLKFYPHDEQKCYMQIESYGFSAEELHLGWVEGDAVKFSEKLSSNSKYILLHHEEKTTTIVTLSGTNYSRLILEMHFARNAHPFLISVYLPHIILVILSWASFCIDHKNVTLRLIYLGLIMFLMLKLVPTGTEPDLHITALDIWTAICVMFILSSFLESIFINQMANEEDIEQTKSRESEEQAVTSGHMNEEKAEKKSDGSKRSKIFARLTRKYHTDSKRADVVCRVISPIIFLVFNIIYWSVCCSASKYD